MAAALPFAPTGAPNGNFALNVGFPYGGTPAAAGGIPNMGNLAVNTLVRPTSGFGTQNFTSVMAHYVSINNPADPDGAQNCKDLGTGMLVFVRETTFVDNKHTRRMGARYDGVSVGPNTAEFKELTQLNEYLRKHSKDYDSADAVVAEWRLMGVIKNEAAPTSAAYGSARVSRVLNLVVSHRVSVLNYWVSSRILQTQKLYLVVRRVQPDVGGEGYFQVEPWTSPNLDYPPLDYLSGPLVNDFQTFAAVIYVGKSTDQSWAQVGGNNATDTDMSRSLVKRGLMNQLEIYLGI
jgi:hypothetical protein